MAQTFRPPATQRLYDVCVVGSELGGVVAGALLARRGFRVLHVAHDDPGFHYVDHGYVLPLGPAVLPSPRHLPSAEAVLAELGLATDLSRTLAPSDPDLQLLLPRHRVDLSREPALLRAELRREWPREAEALEAAFAGLSSLFDFAGFFLRAAPPLPPDGFVERHAVRKAIKVAASAPGAPSRRVDEARPFEGFHDHELVKSVVAAHRFLTYLDGPPSPLSLVRLLGGAFRGTNRLPGGLGTLREMVRRRIAESRGELRGGPGEPAVAQALELEGNRVAAVRLSDSPDAHVARAFVVATDAARLLALLPPEVREGRAAAALRKVHPSRQLLTVNLVVKETALPPALGENVLALRDAAGGDGLDNAVFLQVLPARRDAKKGTEKGPQVEALADERVVCASGFVPAGEARPALGENVLALRDAGGGDGLDNAVFLQVLPARRDARKGTEKGPQVEALPDERVVCASGFVPAGEGRAALEAAATRIREAVADAIPFFERHLVAESAPALVLGAGGDLPAAHPLHVCEKSDDLGVAGLPVRGPWKNLFFAGREVIPGLGVEGEFYAGIQAAGHVAALLGRKDVLK